MSRNRERMIEIMDDVLSQGEKGSPEDWLFSYKGVLYPAKVTSPETFEALKSFEARSDDMILAGYPKSGECCFLDKLNTQYCNPELFAIIQHSNNTWKKSLR